MLHARRRRGRRAVPLTVAVALCVLSLWRAPAVDAAITNPTVVPASTNAGVTGNAVVTFDTDLGIPVGGRITVVFPTSFFIQIGGTQLIAPSGIDSASTITMGANTNTVVVTVVGTAVTTGTVTFTVDGVSNPGAGTTTKYTIRTADANGGTIESTTNVPASTISKWPFAQAGLVFSTANAGAQQQIVISLRTGVTLRAGSLIEVKFPTLPASTFVISDAVIINRVGLSASSSIATTVMPFLQLAVMGGDISAGKDIAVSLDRIYNPAAQTLGTFVIRTRHSTGGILQDTNPAISARDSAANPITAIVSTTLSSSAAITAATYFAGMPTTYAIRFPNAAYLVNNARMTVTFPARFAIAGATLASISNIPSTGTTLTLTATTAEVTLGTGVVTAGANRGFSLANVLNPGSSCGEYIYEYCSTTWETYTIEIRDAAGQLYERSTTVPGTPIVKKPMVFARVRPLKKKPFVVTPVVLNFTTQATIPQGGKIEVEFPTGFQLGAVAASGHYGMSALNTAVTVAGLSVSLAVAAASIAPSARLTVTFSAITTPASTATGMYKVRTRDAGLNILEEHESVNGEGCLYLNSCNGHGTCTLYSSTCICDPGWGADTDIATYRSPDCTLRTCPSGKSWNNMPKDGTTSHEVVEECSGMGTCDRSTGLCVCFEGFVGSACQRLSCPGNCRNRGKCVTMRELAGMRNALPLSPVTTYAGAQTTWDEDRIMGCTCDSAWAVGTGSGEIQVTEYFGGDCSRRHCPTGDDPETPDTDETECNGVFAPGGFIAGDPGNLCHVECSNRGICNYRSGTCQCFPGFTGFACQRSEVLSK